LRMRNDLRLACGLGARESPISRLTFSLNRQITPSFQEPTVLYGGFGERDAGNDWRLLKLPTDYQRLKTLFMPGLGIRQNCARTSGLPAIKIP
jgi:hypothetical protein